MSMISSEYASHDRAGFPAASPFGPAPAEAKSGNEVWRAVLTSMLALYPVLAAMAVALVSLSFMTPSA